LKLRNALRNEKTAKLVFIFKCMRSASWIKNYVYKFNIKFNLIFKYIH